MFYECDYEATDCATVWLSQAFYWMGMTNYRIGPHRTRLVVKTGSAKTKTKTKTEVFETKTKTANGSMKQNAHSSRKNYFYQKLQRHWLMSSLQLSIAFSKHQVTEYIVTHACPVGTHEDASVAKDSFHRAEVAGTQYMEDTNRCRGLNCSLLRMVLTVAFGDDDADSKYDCSVHAAVP